MKNLINKSIKKDLELLYEIGTFRFVQRTWTQFYTKDFANDTEHSFRVAMLALLIAKYEKVKDTGKILTMALIHDLPECRTGDVHYLSRQYTIRDENQAIKDMFKGTVLEKDIMKTWDEYEERKTKISKIVKDADMLDVDLELAEQESVGNTLRQKFNKHRTEAAYPRLYTTTAKKIWQEIQKGDPHDWHLFGRNRINAGDWKDKVK